LKKEITGKDLEEELAVAESKLGGLIKESLGINCVYDNSIQELFRGIRQQVSNLITGL
jgi:nucleolar protein 58